MLDSFGHAVSLNVNYHYFCFYTGEGSFGRVLQARAEGIVKGLPDRNIVAVKACRGTTKPLVFRRVCM